MSQKIKKKFIDEEVFNEISLEIDGDVSEAVSAEQAARILADEEIKGDLSDANYTTIEELDDAFTNLDASYASQAEIDALQADVDQNKVDGDADRAAIRDEFAVADSTLQENIDAVSGDLATEVSNRELADEEIKGDLSDAFYTTIEGLDDALAQEIADREQADFNLQDNIDTEIADREAADSTLQSNIDAVSGDLATEVSDREAADSTLQSNIDAEKARIDAILDASEADKDSFAEIVSLINSVDTENDTAFGNYVLSNDAALAALQADVDQNEADGDADRAAIRDEFAVADTTLQDNIDAVSGDLATEVSNRVLADEEIKGDLSDAFYTTIEGLDDALAQEASDRFSADDTLQMNIDQEVADREAADSTLQSNIDQEVSDREAADTTLQDNIDQEVADRVLADEEIKGDLSDAFYTTIEGLDDALAQEASDRFSADDTLQMNIDQEVADREAADTILQENIDVETARIDAILDASEADKDSFAEIVSLINSVDTENDTAFGNYVLSNDAALAQEVADREAADSALDGRVTTLEGEMDSAESRLDALEAVAWVKEKFELVQADIDNGFITLSQSPVSGSESVFVGRLAMHEGAAEDYQVSGSQITFLNDLVGPGNQKLQVGDVIYVKYQA